jgi:hypothetical protein
MQVKTYWLGESSDSHMLRHFFRSRSSLSGLLSYGVSAAIYVVTSTVSWIPYLSFVPLFSFHFLSS